jgi:hypothetical protein
VSRTNRCFCASLPFSMSVGASIAAPWLMISNGRRGARNSSAMIVARACRRLLAPP